MVGRAAGAGARGMLVRFGLSIPCWGGGGGVARLAHVDARRSIRDHESRL